jgi:hypothetical protein
MKRRGIPLFSIAPRFIGEFQKGIDYIGDPARFAESFRTHAAIARLFGYRISVHSGSDKFAVYPAIGRETRGFFHLKTAGTHWLQALQVIGQKQPAFFRRLYAHALRRLPAARSYYHITPDVSKLPQPEAVGDPAALLADPHARQVLHVTYGEMLRDEEIRGQIYGLLGAHIEAYWESVGGHTARHLDLLGVGRS